MPAIIRIDFETHAESISKALQAELAKVQGVVASANTGIEQARAASTKRIVASAVQEESKGIADIAALKQKAEQEINQMRSAFSAKTWGSEKEAATAIVGEISKLQESKEQNIYLLKKGNLSKEQADYVKAEQTKVELSLKTMRRIALENEQIAERGAGASVGIMGQQRNIEKLKSSFEGMGKLAAVSAIGVGLFNKEIGETIGAGAQTAATAAMMAAGIGDLGKGLLGAEKAQKLMNLAMAAAPWALAIAAIAGVVLAISELTSEQEKAAEATKTHEQAMLDLISRQDEMSKSLDATYQERKAQYTDLIDRAELAEVTGKASLAKQLRDEAAFLKSRNAITQMAIDHRTKIGESFDEYTGRKTVEKNKAAKKEAKETTDYWTGEYMSRLRKYREFLEEQNAADIKRADFASKMRQALKQDQIEVTGIIKESLDENFINISDNQKAELFALELKHKGGLIKEKEYQDQLYRLKEKALIDELQLLVLYYGQHSKEAENKYRELLALMREHQLSAAEITKSTLKDEIDQYIKLAQGVSGLIDLFKKQSNIEHQRNKEADEALERQLDMHERIARERGKAAKTDKERQEIEAAGEQERLGMIGQRQAEEDAAAKEEEARAKEQQRGNLLTAASSMVSAIAHIIDGNAGIPLVGWALAGGIIAAATAAFATAKAAFGFKQGGFTGDGDPNEVAGPVHRREFVLPAGSFARDSQGKIIHIDPSFIGGQSPQSIKMGGFISRSQAAYSGGGLGGSNDAESIKMGGFISIMENKFDQLIAAVRSPKVLSSDRMLLNDKIAGRRANRITV